MKNQLEQIVEYKKEELLVHKRVLSFKDAQSKARDTEPARGFLSGFQKGKINIIAEVKKASPSAGIIRDNFNAVDIAHIYADNGARALSVLTDEKFFMGSLAYLEAIKKAVQLPCLRKDFTIDEYHVFQARAHGADAILLIVAILDDHQLKDYRILAEELGMTVLVEVHDASELDRATASKAKLIGVNNRNLKTFKTDVQTSFDLQKKMPAGVYSISESGLKTHDDCVKLLEAGYDGFLIGESLMREKDFGKKLKEIIG